MLVHVPSTSRCFKISGKPPLLPCCNFTLKQAPVSVASPGGRCYVILCWTLGLVDRHHSRNNRLVLAKSSQSGQWVRLIAGPCTDAPAAGGWQVDERGIEREGCPQQLTLQVMFPMLGNMFKGRTCSTGGASCMTSKNDRKQAKHGVLPTSTQLRFLWVCLT